MKKTNFLPLLLLLAPLWNVPAQADSAYDAAFPNSDNNLVWGVPVTQVSVGGLEMLFGGILAEQSAVASVDRHMNMRWLIEEGPAQNIARYRLSPQAPALAPAAAVRAKAKEIAKDIIAKDLLKAEPSAFKRALIRSVESPLGKVVGLYATADGIVRLINAGMDRKSGIAPAVRLSAAEIKELFHKDSNALPDKQLDFPAASNKGN